MKKTISVIIATLVATAAASAQTNEGPESFYRGKTINLVIGFAPGGGSDLTGRMIAQHIRKHIPGNPSVVPRNLAGAGGIIAMNSVGAALPDGLTAYWGTAGFEVQMIGDPALRLDLRTFEFIGGGPGTEVFYVRTDVEPPLKTPLDLKNVTNLWTGGFATTSIKDMRLRLALDILAFKHNHVTGFSGNGPARLALQQKTISGYVEGFASYTTQVKPNLVDKGEVIPIFHYGLYDEKGQSQPLPGAEHIPTFEAYFKQIHGAEPTGVAADAFRALASSTVVMQRWMGLTPRSPPDAVRVLREAWMKLATDEEYLSDSEKLEGSRPTLVSGATAENVVREALNSKPEIIEFLKKRVAAEPK